MMKKFINQILKEGKSNEFTKDVENSIRYFLNDFSLNNIEVIYRKLNNIIEMINFDDCTKARYNAFSILNNSKISVDDIDELSDKLWLSFIKKENEINSYLEKNPIIAEKTRKINSLTNEIIGSLQDANIKLQWKNRILNSFEILSIIGNGSYDSEIIKLIKNFKVPSNDFHEIWMANSPSTDYINRSIFKIVDALDNEEAITEDITGEDVEMITDTLLDILVLISEEIILNLKN